MKKDISVIVPIYNEEESLPELVEWIDRVMQQHQFSYEVWLMNDGSTDNSWQVIKQLSAQYPNVHGKSFQRNYGKAAVLNVGFKLAQGDVVITMDADLQDSPDEIPELYRLIKEENYDLVSGWKKKRYDPLSKTIPTKLFNAATSFMSGIRLHDFNCGLKAYKNKVVKSLEVHGEMHRYIPVLAKWNGFNRIGEKVVKHYPRKYGTTKYGWERFINGFLDLLSISFVTRFKKRPMHFFGLWGTIAFLTGFFIAVFLIAEKLIKLRLGETPRDVVAQPLFFLGLTSIIVGVQLFLAGFLGEIMALDNARSSDYQIADEC
ncbi:MAG: glycosyltransferase family 2 protein [Cytophagales bacterium]|nr:glycosyltransferase family 2 protein [Cytophagales bacterium]MDW8384495.1 glycosyltransferase family 2 protein [Flammeovirgaceae bacterium]